MTNFMDRFKLSNLCYGGIAIVAYAVTKVYTSITGNELFVCWKCGKERTEKKATALNLWLPTTLVIYVGACDGSWATENLEKIIRPH